MCGIIGIAGDKDVAEIIKESLKWLSYRGYDSAGIAVKNEENIEWEKHLGKVEDTKFKKDLRGNIGIGHTRWATHGLATKSNAHPHLDRKDGEIAIVHNGIINNYKELKDELIEKDYSFSSQTDSEVIPHLIKEHLKYYKNNYHSFLYAFRDAVKDLEGANAVAAIYAHQDNIYAYRNLSPLVIGIGEGKRFISSDIPAFLEYTNRFLPLEDNQICVLSKGGYKVYDLNLRKIPIGQLYKCPFGFEDIKKESKHFMEKEIQEQPKVLKRTLDNLPIGTLQKIRNYIRKGEIKKIYLTGCGSSFYACIAGKYMLERLVRIPAEAILSSEFKYTAPNIVREDSLIIAITQSGETYDTYSVIDSVCHTENGNPHVLAITNIPYSSIERLLYKKIEEGVLKKIGEGVLDDNVIRIGAGFEICVVATKTYTAQLYLLSLLGLKISKGMFTNESLKISGKVESILKDREINRKIEEIVCEEKEKKGFFVIGREMNLSTCMEAALKLKEICYVYAEGLPGGELKHGSLAVIDKDTPTIVIFPPPEEKKIWQSTFNNLMEIKAREGPIISVCFKGDEEVKSESDYVIEIPNTEWIFSPILQIIPLQLLAYKLSIEKGIDPDHPRNLAKTITVE